MQAIDYRRHWRMLIWAAALFVMITWLTTRLENTLNLVGDVFMFVSFGSMGALHAIALVLSFQDRAGVKPFKATAFTALVALASIAALYSPLLLAPLLGVLNRVRFRGHDEVNFVLILAFASAFGATSYWLLLRFFWMKERRWASLRLTVCLCPISTLASWMLPNLLPYWMKDYAMVIPTLAWWAAFSLSLCLSDRRLATQRTITGLVPA